jgi:hypothetical protein
MSTIFGKSAQVRTLRGLKIGRWYRILDQGLIRQVLILSKKINGRHADCLGLEVRTSRPVSGVRNGAFSISLEVPGIFNLDYDEGPITIARFYRTKRYPLDDNEVEEIKTMLVRLGGLERWEENEIKRIEEEVNLLRLRLKEDILYLTRLKRTKITKLG